MATDDALSIASVIEEIVAGLKGYVNAAITAIAADGGIDDLSAIVDVESLNLDDWDAPTKLTMNAPYLGVWRDGQSVPEESMVDVMYERFRIGLTVEHHQRQTVNDAELDSQWYERALMLGFRRMYKAGALTGVIGLKYVAGEPEKLPAVKDRNRRRGTVYFEVTLRTTKGCA